MSVQTEIDRIITAVGNAYSKVSEKGGTVPASQTVANLATAIDSIPAGGAPSLQSKSVTYTSIIISSPIRQRSARAPYSDGASARRSSA